MDVETAELRQNARKRALDEIRASIVAQRGSLEGLLDEYLEERHEEARREWLDSKPDGSESEVLNDE
jgi:hypothetical protein